jgi:hypothetical protein
MMSWTGWGWLAFMLFMGLGLACLGLATATGQGGDGLAFAFAALYTVIGVPVHWFVGTRLNSERTPQGRRSLDVHVFNGLPMQHWVFWYPLCGAIVVAFVLSGNGEAGWSRTVVGAALVGVIIYIIVARRRAARSRPGSEEGELLFPGVDTAADGSAAVPRTRRKLAAERGWRFEYGGRRAGARHCTDRGAAAGQAGGPRPAPVVLRQVVSWKVRRQVWQVPVVVLPALLRQPRRLPGGGGLHTLPVPDDTAAMTALLVAQIDLIDG